jgi:CBS domain-containing protein
MNASDVMVSHVITVKPNAPLQEVARILLTNRISGAPVVDDSGKLVGIISEGDLLRRTAEGAWPKSWGPPPRRGWAKWLMDGMDAEASDAEYVTQPNRDVAEIMTREIILAQPETPVSDIATLVVHHRIKRVPIVQNGKIVGLVSRANLIQALAGLTTKPLSRAETDGNR